MSFSATPIGDLVVKCGTWNPKKNGSDEFDYIDLSSVDKDAKAITEIERHKCDEAPSRARQLVAENDVLVATVRPNLNGVALVRAEHHGMTASTGYCVLRPIPEELDSRFLFNWVKTGVFVQRMVDVATGANYPAVSDAKVKASTIPLPPLAEQKRIAGILDAADALRAKRRESLAQLDTLLQSTFLHLFGDPVTNPMGWEVVPITEAVIGKYGIKAGPFGSALKKEDYVESGYRVYGQEQVIAGRFDIGDYYIDGPKFRKLENCAISSGDLLVSLVGSFGKVLIVPDGIEPGIINPRLLKITPRRELVTSLYLATFIQNEATQRKLQSMSHGGTMGILNASLLKQLTVPIPPLDLQRRFAAIVESVERQKAHQRAHLAELDTLFASLQHRAFEGEL